MPMFHAHIPAQKFSSEEKRALADALNLALHEAMDTPMDDRFVIISEHKDDEFFIHPTFPDLKRSDKSMIVTVTTGTSRTMEQNASSRSWSPDTQSKRLASARTISP